MQGLWHGLFNQTFTLNFFNLTITYRWDGNSNPPIPQPTTKVLIVSLGSTLPCVVTGSKGWTILTHSIHNGKLLSE